MQDSRINVLQIVGNARLGGVAACLINYFRRVDLSRFRFDFVTYAPSPFDDLVKEVDGSARVYYISPFQKNFLKGIFDLEKICKNNNYDIVHSHLTTLSAFSLTAAAHTDVPVRICHAHSTFNKNSEHYLVKSFLRPFASDHATHLMACSRATAENIFGKRAQEATILPNAIETDRFLSDERAYAEAREKLGLRGKVILFTGRFEYQKNLPLLVSAFSLMCREEDATLVLIGDGKERHALHELIAGLGIKKSVKIVPPCDPTPWYKAADVFCLPSRYEGLSIAAVEAQTAGLKCILSDSVSREVNVTDNCVFLPDDPEAWAAELKKPCPHLYDCKKLLEDAHLDIEKEAHLLTDFYKKALAEKR